ncbi:MAG: chalcone isomerase family protein [Gammaproteobacteria bacterium]|nr:chalcone isomerase family protein [Gammaproteobacteria bacterium]
MTATSESASLRAVKALAFAFMRSLRFALLMMCGASGVAQADDAGKLLTEPETGARYPVEVRFEHDGARYRLSATGTAVRTKFWFSIYSIAHYLETGPKATPAQVLARIMSPDTAKQVTLTFARELDAEQVRDGFMESFIQHARPEEIRATQAALQAFLRAVYKDVVEGERFTVRWLPNGRLISMYEGKVVSAISNATFARVCWSVWFGDASIVDRERLIALRVLQPTVSVDHGSVDAAR